MKNTCLSLAKFLVQFFLHLQKCEITLLNNVFVYIVNYSKFTLTMQNMFYDYKYQPTKTTLQNRIFLY